MKNKMLFILLAISMTATVASAKNVSVVCDNGLSILVESSVFLDQGKREVCRVYLEELKAETKLVKGIQEISKDLVAFNQARIPELKKHQNDVSNFLAKYAKN